MNKHLRVAGIGLLAIFFSFLAQAETEPNNDINNANTLVIGQAQNNSLSTNDNDDWFKITIPAQGSLHLSTTTISGVCPIFYLYDQDPIYGLGNTYHYECTETYKELTAPNLLPGTYFVKVNRFSGSGDYTILANFTQAAVVNDIEKNDSIHLANTIQPNDSLTGLFGYKSNNYTDNTDWYKIEIPNDGKLTIRTHNALTGCLTAYLFDKEGSIKLADTYGAVCSDSIKTMQYRNLLPGTYHLKLNKYSGYGAYILTTTYTEANFKADTSTNDSIQGALPLPLNDSVMGHLGFYGNDYRDNKDFYFIDIPTEGSLLLNTSNDFTGCITAYLYDQDTIHSLRDTYWFPCDTFYNDMVHERIAPGRYFIAVNRYTGFSTYTLRNEFTPAPYHIDTVYDDSLKYAQHLPENDTVSALQGYKGNQYTDNQDWWKVTLDEAGKIEFQTWSDSTLCLTAYLYDTLNKNLANTYWYACDVYQKEATSPYLEKGTYYIQTKAYSGYGNYHLTYNLLPAPQPEFSVYQNLFDITTQNMSIDAETYLWDFGDGKTETSVSPKHTYAAPGVYDICLTATNAVGSTEICHQVEFKGIQSVSPKKGGNTGDATLTVYGGGFTEKSTFWLSDGNTVLYPDTAILVQRGALKGTVDLREKDPSNFDIIVDYRDGSPQETLPHAFEIIEGIQAAPWVNIVGRNKILYNRWQTFTINYGNDGNVDATGVPLWIVVPNTPGTEVRFVDFEVDIPITDDPMWQQIKDSVPIYVDVDHFDGEAKQVRIYPLFIPVIPSGEHYSIKIQVKTDSDIELLAWASPPMFQSPVDPAVAECIRWAQVNAVANGLINILNEQLPGVACVNSVMQSVYGMTYGSPQPITSHLWNISRATLTCASEFVGPLKAYKISISVIELGLDIYDNYSAVNECKKPKTDPKDPNKQKDPHFNDKPRSKRKARAVSSFDPNEMVGPSGYTDNNYVKEGTDFNYSVYFENKATATAPAGEVIIIDTLDKANFDMSSFELTYFNFGDSTYTVPQGLQEYSLDIDMRPVKPIVLRINASIDTVLGIARWQYISLDTLTMDLTEDPDAGFLPPNTIAPEGEGHVGFKIDLKNNFSYSNAIANRATIFFDANPPIFTNTYINYIDNEAPISLVNAITPPVNDTVFTVNWSGSDNYSEIAGYTVMVSENDEDYTTWIGLTQLKSAKYYGSPGSEYQFKCYAVDNVGNKEAIHLSADASVEISEETAILKPGISSFNVYPNPTKASLNISFGANKSGWTTVTIYDQSGREVKQVELGIYERGLHSQQINLTGISPGVYIIELNHNNIKKRGELMILP